MWRTKKDVEKHIQDVLKKVKNDNERKLLGFNFAKLFLQVGEYKLAKQHLASFLSVKESSAPGHRLAGQILEALNNKEDAVRSYRRSYDLDSSQRDLVFKLCSLICELPPSPANCDLQRCWLERAEALQPQHSVVFELRQRLMLSDGVSEADGLLKNEALVKPCDMNLRIHLLKLYLDSGRTKEAYEHVLRIEALQVFCNEPAWYNCVLQVLESHGEETGREYYLHLLNALDRHCFLKIAKGGAVQKAALSDIGAALLRIDSTLQKAAESGLNSDLLLHFTCQVYFMAGLLVIQRAQAGLEEEYQALSYAVTLFAIAYNQTPASLEVKVLVRKLAEAFNSSATYRQSQCGHCIVAWESKEGRKWVVDTVKKLDTPEGRSKMLSSCGVLSDGYCSRFVFTRAGLELPSFCDLLDVDQVALQLNQDDLDHVVWLGTRYLTMHRPTHEMDFAHDFSKVLGRCRIVRDIPLSAPSWNSTAPETLSALDVEAFIFATIYCTVSQQERQDKVLDTVPAPLTRHLCTDQQTCWWQAAMKLVSGSGKENLGEMRKTLQKGIEVIRLSGSNHGVPLELIVKLARTFAGQASKARKFPSVEVPAPISTDVLTVEQTEALEVQAARYWRAFMDMTQSSNRFTPCNSGRMFDLRTSDMDLEAALVEGKIYLGYQAWRAGRKEEAQKLLSQVNDPYASYFEGLVFKELAEEELRRQGFEYRASANVLLNKSRDALYATQDRLRGPGLDRFHPLNQRIAELIEKVDTKLNVLLGNVSMNSMSVTNGVHEEEDLDSEESTEKEFLTPSSSTPLRKSVLMSSRLSKSVRVESRPSPERLDAQLRQMVLRQEEFNQSISNELKQIRAEVVDIKNLIMKLETHLEAQVKEQAELKEKKSAESNYDGVVDPYEEYGYEDEEGDWEDEAQLQQQQQPEQEAKMEGKIKSIPSLPAQSLPMYAPPFPQTPSRPPAYGYVQPPFAPTPAYQQYPPYPGYGMPGAYPMAPAYPYHTAFPGSPMAPGLMGQGLQPPAPAPVAGIQAPVVPPVIPPIAAPVAAPGGLLGAGSVFSRLGVQPLVEAAAPSSPAPHAYQIALPAAASPEKLPEPVPPILAPATSTTPAAKSFLASIPKPEFSSVTTPEKDSGGGAPAGQLKLSRDRKTSSGSEGSREEEHECLADFKPVIPLPEEVPVVTGEEDEETLFDQRAKLFRLAGGEWKERGIGRLKLLRHPETSKVRLVMRREQVLKICANHYVTNDMKLTEMRAGAGNNCWIWAAMDFADGEGHLEKFCARFKTSELAAEFHKAVEDAKAFVPPSGAAPAPLAKAEEPTEAKVESLAAKFAPAAGSWTCGSCYVSNSAGVVRCVACETLKPGAEVAPAAADGATQAPAAQFKFGVPSAPSSGFKFGVPVPAATVAQVSATTTVVSAAPAQFSFGVPALAPVEVPTVASDAAPVKLTSGVTAATAPTPAEVSTTVASAAVPAKFSFGVPAAPVSDSAPAAGPIAAPKFLFTASSTPAAAAPIKFGVASPPKPQEDAAAKPNSALFTAPAAAPAAKTESGGFVFGSAASLATPDLKFNTPPATSTTSTLGQGSATLESILAAPTHAPSAGMTFGLAKPSFSFSIPGAPASGKAHFSFSPPKPLATNAKADSLLPAEQPKVAAAAPFGVFSFSSLTPSKEVVKAEEEKIEVKDSLAPPEQPKITLGGFSFSSAPTLAPAKDDKAEEKKAEVKPSPFSGFVFKGFGAPAVTAEAAAQSKPAAGSGGMLFSMLAKSVPSAGFPVTANQEFPGAGSKLFSAPHTDKKADEDAEEDDAREGEEYEPSATFEPVIPLPALVDVASGEEDEKVLFSERAFLYRFAAETKEWKEKGRGDMKILEHNVTGRTRLLMRREQVLKICCNHYITSMLSLKPSRTAERTWNWSAKDFSEGETTSETFALKFKSVEHFERFKTVFEEAQRKGDLPQQQEQPSAPAEKEPVKSLAEQFKPKEGSWECSGCYSRNNVDVTKCPSCETLKPGTVSPAVAPLSLAEQFKPKQGSWECSGCYSRNNANVTKCPSCETLKPGTVAPVAAPAAPTPFQFGSAGGFKFGAAPPAADAAPKSVFGAFTSFGSTPAPSFGGGGVGGFSFSLPTAPASAPAAEPSDDEEDAEEEEADVHFEPVIPLPDKIDVKTGEEDEEAIFCHRAKLLRFADGEWKERGIGDVKVLRHKSTNKFRLLMRREQILKICLNHAITCDLKFIAKDERSWLWAANDFAEGAGVMEKLVIRFRGADEANNFMAAVDRAKIDSAQSPPASSVEDVEVVDEKKATDDERRRAEQLMLPPNFYLYKHAEPCPGCRGCDEDDADEDAPAPAPVQVQEPVGSVVEKGGVVADEPPRPLIFGNGMAPAFGKTAAAVQIATPASGSMWSALSSTSAAQLSFSSLASGTGSGGFNKPAEFSWSGAGQKLFSAAPPATASPSKAEADDDGDEEGEVENNDPHFEPIIPLPALVDVKTGEEDENVIFSHRAKLYRFESSTKEWKERGVGDIKILHDEHKNTFRVLLRRDQIHKLACNHLLTADMVLMPLLTSTTAWTWLAMDYSQGELVPEKFAVRFKTEEPAKLFRDKFEESQADLRKLQHAPSDTNSTSTEPVIDSAPAPSAEAPEAVAAAPVAEVQGEDDDEDKEEDAEEEEEEEYEDIEETVMFEEHCTLSSLDNGTWHLVGTGNLKIIYDDDMLCARIIVEPEGGDPEDQYLCDNVIAIETKLMVDGRECQWSAIDYSTENPAPCTFRAQLGSNDLAMEFQSIFAEAKQYAEKSDVHDEPDLGAAGYDHGADDQAYVGGKFN